MATNREFRVKSGAYVEGSSGVTIIGSATQDALIITGRNGGSSNRSITLLPATLTGSQTITFPDATGTIALTANKLSAFASTTSAELAGVISDETGSGSLVFATSPTLTTPVLGVASATSINKVAITAPATGSTLTIADGKTFTASNTLTFTGTDASSVAFGTGGTVAYTGNKLSVFAATTSAELAGVISDETGSGKLVFDTSPTLTTPNIGVATGTSFNSITGLSSTTPVMDGVAAVGTATTTARADHVHATDTSRAPLNNPSFTGTVTLAADPTLALHAATKQYVDGVATGVNAHDAVAYATTGALGTAGNLVGGTITTTYNNNSTGVGATLTIATSSNWTAITIDGQTLVVGDRVLIKDQATALQNGIYTVTSVGTVGTTTSFVFTRAVDNDQVPELGQGDLTYIVAGPTNGSQSWVQIAVVTTVGTSAINWSQFSGVSTTSAGAGLVKNGNSIDAVGTANRILVNADSIDIASTYVGQSSITTLGTIGTGTWQGSLIGATYGGTGVNNGSNTITLGGNVSTAGTFTTTGSGGITLAGGSSLTTATLPATGAITLVDLNTGQSLTNKKLGSLTTNGLVTTSGGDGTLSVTQMGTGIATFLTTPTSANLAAAITDETGSASGVVVFSNSPAFTGTVTYGANAATVNASGSTTGVTAATLSSICATASYDGGEFIVKIKNGVNSQVVKSTWTTDGTTVWMTSYSEVSSNVTIANVDLTVVSNNITMTVTPVSGTTGTTSIKVLGNILAA